MVNKIVPKVVHKRCNITRWFSILVKIKLESFGHQKQCGIYGGLRYMGPDSPFINRY